MTYNEKEIQLCFCFKANFSTKANMQINRVCQHFDTPSFPRVCYFLSQSHYTEHSACLTEYMCYRNSHSADKGTTFFRYTLMFLHFSCKIRIFICTYQKKVLSLRTIYIHHESRKSIRTISGSYSGVFG